MPILLTRECYMLQNCLYTNAKSSITGACSNNMNVNTQTKVPIIPLMICTVMKHKLINLNHSYEQQLRQ